MKRIQLWLFLGVILLAILLRFYQLGSNPPSLDWDEVSSGYNAYSILHTGRDEYGSPFPLTFRSFDDYKPPVYIYLTVPSVALFGLTEFAVRLPAAVFGVLGVITVYFLVLELFDDETNLGKYRRVLAILTMFFVAISPWHLQFSRAAFEGNIGVTFLALGFLFFLKGLKKSFHFLFAFFFFIVSEYSYHSFRVLIPLLVITLLILFWKKVYKEKYVYLGFLILILSFIPVLQSAFSTSGTGARLSMVTVFSDPSLRQLSAEKVAAAKQSHNIFQQLIYNRRLIFIPTILKGYLDHFGFQFLFLNGDSGVQHHAYNMGMLYLWDLPFIMLGIFYLLKNRSKQSFALVLLFFFAPLPAAITTGTPHPVRAIAMIPAFQIFSAVGVMTFITFFKKGLLRNLAASLFAVLLVINVIYYLYSYYILTPIQYGYFWQYGSKEAVLYAKQHENTYQKIIMTYAYDQPYIYYLFYDRIDPAWYQRNWNYTHTGVVERFYRKIGKYEFKNITTQDLQNKNTLLIGTPSEIPNGVGRFEKEIHFPDGRIAYKIVSL